MSRVDEALTPLSPKLIFAFLFTEWEKVLNFWQTKFSIKLETPDLKRPNQSGFCPLLLQTQKAKNCYISYPGLVKC